MAEKLRNYGTEGPHVSFRDRLLWNRGKLQTAAKSVDALEKEFAKHRNELIGRDDLTEYTGDGSELRIRRVGEGFWLTTSQHLNDSLIAGEIVKFSDAGKVTSIAGLIDGWMGYREVSIPSKGSLIVVVTQMRAALNAVMAERQARIATS